MTTAQPALVIEKLGAETQDVLQAARTESGFHRELVNQIRVQAVYRDLIGLPKSALVHNVLGRVFFLKGDEYNSRKHHQMAINMDATNSTHYVDYGVTLEMFNRFDEAATVYKDALKQNPHDLKALKHSVDALTILQRYDEAARYLDELIKMRPSDGELQMHKEMLMDNLFPEERFRESFIEKVEASAKEVESGHTPTFSSIEEMEAYLADLPNG